MHISKKYDKHWNHTIPSCEDKRTGTGPKVPEAEGICTWQFHEKPLKPPSHQAIFVSLGPQPALIKAWRHWSCTWPQHFTRLTLKISANVPGRWLSRMLGPGIVGKPGTLQVPWRFFMFAYVVNSSHCQSMSKDDSRMCMTNSNLNRERTNSKTQILDTKTDGEVHPAQHFIF